MLRRCADLVLYVFRRDVRTISEVQAQKLGMERNYLRNHVIRYLSNMGFQELKISPLNNFADDPCSPPDHEGLAPRVSRLIGK